jgi:hypothetical protein
MGGIEQIAFFKSAFAFIAIMPDIGVKRPDLFLPLLFRIDAYFPDQPLQSHSVDKPRDPFHKLF